MLETEDKIRYLLTTGRVIHTNTLEMRNSILLKSGQRCRCIKFKGTRYKNNIIKIERNKFNIYINSSLAVEIKSRYRRDW